MKTQVVHLLIIAKMMQLIKKINSLDFVYIKLDAEIEQLKIYKELYQDELKKINSKIESIEKSKDRLLQMLADPKYRDWETDRKSTRLNSSHSAKSRMPSSA